MAKSFSKHERSKMRPTMVKTIDQPNRARTLPSGKPQPPQAQCQRLAGGLAPSSEAHPALNLALSRNLRVSLISFEAGQTNARPDHIWLYRVEFTPRFTFAPRSLRCRDAH